MTKKATAAAVLLALLPLLVLLVPAAPASAHATLVSSSPEDGAVVAEAPREVELTFDEPVRLAADGLALFDASGEPVEVSGRSEDAVVTARPGALTDGSYVLTWRVVSADGHPIAGSLTFSVGAPSPSVAAPQPPGSSPASLTRVLSAVTALYYLALLLAAGLVAFLTVLLPGDVRADGARRRLIATARIAATVATAAVWAMLPLTLVYRAGGGLGLLLSPTRWGPTGALDQVVALLTTLALALVAARLGAPGGTDRRLVQAAAAAALVLPALVGHTRAVEPQLALVVLDALHLVAGSVWLGGLTGLALTLSAVAGRPRLAASLLARFSAVAAGCLAVLVAAGAVLTWRIVGSWSGLVGTDYGRALLVKVALVALVAGLAAWNRFALLPRTGADGGFEAGRRAVGVVRRTVVAEVGLLVAVLAVTGVLVNRSPNTAVESVPSGRTGTQQATLGELRVLGTLTPGRPGANVLRVQVQDSTGEPVETELAPTVRVGSATLDLGETALASVDAGTFQADLTLPSAGTWEVQVSQRLSTFENPVAVLAFEVR